MVEPALAVASTDKVGRYELLRRLGSGGMAEVHLARAAGFEGFQKLLVLKRILPHLSADHEFVRMFVAEARLAAILDHSNVVQVFDIGKEGTDYYFTMEYVYGENLQTILRAVRRKGDALPLELAVAIAIGAAWGLHYAHERVGFDGMPLQIVHRDVSPTNVMVTYDGCVKVADFGIAKVTSRTDVTQAGIRKGKVPYMSPEQCRALPLDRRSDVYSLGIVLYECATMGRLFDGDNEFGVMNRIVNGDIPLPSSKRQNFPKDLERIIMRALATDPQRRYASAAELASDLERFARERRLHVSQSALGELMHRLFEPRPFPFGALLGTAAGVNAAASSEHSSVRAGSVPAVRFPDATPASHPSMSASGTGSRSAAASSAMSSATSAGGRSRSQVMPRRSNMLRGVAIGLGAVAAVAVIGVSAVWMFGQPTAAPAAAPAGTPTQPSAAPAVAAPDLAATPSAPAATPTGPTATPSPTPTEPTATPSAPAATPTAPAATPSAAPQAEPADARPSPTAEAAPDAEADEALVIVDEEAKRARRKPTPKKPTGDEKADGGANPDLDSFLPK
jgi:serine/threonine protein kinase